MRIYQMDGPALLVIRFGGLLFPTLALICLSGCQVPDDEFQTASANSQIKLSPCTQEQFPHRGNRKNFQCGSLVVAENPRIKYNDVENGNVENGNVEIGDAETGRTLSLNIVRLPALSQSPKADPVFVLAGGPGQASTEIINSITPWLRKVNRERDFIFVDQRGTGQSNPLDCSNPDNIDLALSRDQQESQQHQALRNCLDNYDADLRWYTTPFAADDIDAVRRALDYEQINLWGASYGTRLALEVIRRHPQAVRSAVLDSVAPIGINLPQFALEDADQSLRRLIDLCEQQTICQQRYPNLAMAVQTLIARFDQQPRTVSVVHPLKGEAFEIYLDGQVIASLLRLGLYVRELGPTLPLIIDSAVNEDYAPLMTLLSLGEEVSDGLSIGLQQTILCAEDVAAINLDQENADGSLLQLHSIEALRKVCGFWPQGILPEDYFTPVSSNTPVLLLSGQLDPVTPPRWADRAAQTLSQHLHIVVAGAHHNVSHLGCIPDLITDFYASLQVTDVDISCSANIKPLRSFVSAAGPAMTVGD